MKYDFEELMKENMDIQETPSRELNERILHYDEEERMMNNKKRKFMQQLPKIAAAALAVVLLSGGIVYASSGLWNHFVAKDFGVEEDHETMKDMNEKGFAQQPQAEGVKEGLLSVTDKDITVTVLQTLADEHSAYVCFEVKYGDQYHAVEEGVTERSPYGYARPEREVFQVDSGITINYCGEMEKVVDDHTMLYDYFLTTADTKDSFKDSVMKLSIAGFEMDHKKCDDNPELIVKDGKWELSWDLSVGTEKRVYHLDRTLTLGEDHVALKDLEVTPLSYNLTVEYPDGVSLDEIGAVVGIDRGSGKLEDLLDENGDMKVIRYLRAGSEENVDRILENLPKGQTFLTLDSLYFRLGDKEFDGMGGMGVTSRWDGDYLYGQFDKVLNLEEVSGVRIAGKCIDLTDVPYEISK